MTGRTKKSCPPETEKSPATIFKGVHLTRNVSATDTVITFILTCFPKMYRKSIESWLSIKKIRLKTLHDLILFHDLNLLNDSIETNVTRVKLKFPQIFSKFKISLVTIFIAFFFFSNHFGADTKNTFVCNAPGKQILEKKLFFSQVYKLHQGFLSLLFFKKMSNIQ